MENSPQPYADDLIDFAEILGRLRRGSIITLGLALIGLSIGLVVSLLATSKQDTVSTLRVTFGFPGIERGTYPNKTKFQADDIRAPDVVNEAVSRLKLQGASSELASRIRGAISVSGIVPPNIIKDRDRIRAAGQTPPPYFPDEYEISLSLPRNYPLTVRQRELLLGEIVSAYLEKFRRTYVSLPAEFGDAFSSLQNADFVEYELILNKEMLSLRAFLEQQIAQSKQFRSPTTNLSFQDLLKETELFTQIRLNEVLGLIYVDGLSKDRRNALVKMDYALRTLEDEEQRLKEEESVVTNLLLKTQDRDQGYVLGIKSQAGQPKAESPVIDQGLIESLLANDAYNFLVRRALDAGLAVKRVQADKAQLVDRRKHLETFIKGEQDNQAAAIARTTLAVAKLETAYKALLAKIRISLDDYAREEYADAVRVTMQPKSDSLSIALVYGAAVGCLTGAVLGMGLSLLKSQSIRPQS